MGRPRHQMSDSNMCRRCKRPALRATVVAGRVVQGQGGRFCPTCDRWLEKKCRQPGCAFCSNRATRPSQMGLDHAEAMATVGEQFFLDGLEMERAIAEVELECFGPRTDDAAGPAVTLDMYLTANGRESPTEGRP